VLEIYHLFRVLFVGLRICGLSNLKSLGSFEVQGDVRIAADSTMFRMVNLLMALSLGVHREQFEQRIGLTWPRPWSPR
jgi:hypothetical protein